MGRRGPAKEPTQAKLARGETRPSRLNAAEPKPAPNEPEMPADMSARAKAVWQRVVAEMRGTGVILRVDSDVLRCYCEAVDLYETAVRTLAGSALLIRHHGDMVKNPLNQVVRDNRDAVRLFARELGLSPSGRSGLNIGAGSGPAGDIDDELPPSPRELRLMAGGRGG